MPKSPCLSAWLRRPWAACFVALLACCGPAVPSVYAQRPSVLRDLVYKQSAGHTLKADVYMPQGPGPFPGVLVVHGGAWSLGDKSHMGFASSLLAQHGYTAVAICYRLAPQHKFPAQLEDCEAAIRWMRLRAGDFKLDPQRLAGYGYSAGAQLVTLLGARCSSQKTELVDPAIANCLRAVVAGGTPCDFRSFPPQANTLAFWLGGTRGERPEMYELASPASFVSAKTPPIFFFHGQEDRILSHQDPAAMTKLLQAQGVPAELLLLPGKGHFQAMFDLAAARAAIQFLDRHMKPQLNDSEDSQAD